MNFTDAAAVEGARMTTDGYLVADAFALRTGIQVYGGSEVGKPEMATVRIFRPEAEVFSADSLASLSHSPLTMNHPAVAVSAANWKDFAVGETGDDVLRDGQRLRVPLIVKDGKAIAAIQGGKRELSAGYQCELVWQDGISPAGEAYDAIQTKIRFNHLAIVDQARAGVEFRIGDAADHWGASPIHDTQPNKEPPMADLTTVVVGDSAVQIAAADASKLEAFKASMKQSLADAQTAHATALAVKDADLAKRDAAIDDLKAKVLSDADIDKRVQARGDLVAIAKVIAKDVATTGLSDAAIRKAVVTAKLGDAAVKDKADAYIDARFEILAEDAAKTIDPLRRVVGDGLQNDSNPAIAAHAQMVKDMESAHRPVAA